MKKKKIEYDDIPMAETGPGILPQPLIHTTGNEKAD